MQKFVVKNYISDSATLEKYLLELDLNFEKNDAFDTVKTCMSVQTELTANDRHSSYSVKGMIPCSGVLYKIVEPSKKELGEKNKSRIFVNESYDDYLDKKKIIDNRSLGWIYNIIDGKSESENVIYNNDEFLIIPDYSWNNKNQVEQMHVLAIVKDKMLMSIRDLQQTNIALLKNIKDMGLGVIQSTYKVDENKIKIFIHYVPSAYLLHVHFVHIDVNYYGTSIDKCHNLDNVIQNIMLDDKYYQRDMRVSEIDNLS
jgi:m7GpppX diphosphatase